MTPRVLLLSALLAFLASVTSYAAEKNAALNTGINENGKKLRKAMWSLSADAGFINSQEDGAAGLYGFRLGYDFPRRNLVDSLLLELVATRGTVEDDGGENVDLSQLRLEALYRTPAIEKFQPVLAVGAGGMLLDGKSESDLDMTFSIGAGVMYPLKNYLLLRADVRDVLLFESGINDNWEVTAGLMYVFGQEREKKAPPPPDKDADGVPDKADRCANTPPGVAVDAKGCPTDTGDRDKDGVPNYRDRCPETMANVKVDESGCEMDSDGDGILDRLDECPKTPSGLKVNEDGCVGGGSTSTVNQAPVYSKSEEPKAELLEVKQPKALTPVIPKTAPAPAAPVGQVAVPRETSKEVLLLPAEKQALPETAVKALPTAVLGTVPLEAAKEVPLLPGEKQALPKTAVKALPVAGAGTTPLAVGKEVPLLPAERQPLPETAVQKQPTPVLSSAGAPLKATLYRKFTTTFAHDQWKLSPAGEKIIAEMTEQLRRENRTFIIKIEGHTDSVGTEGYNLGLSLKRATSAAIALITRAGFDPNLLFLRGYGETKPVADNGSLEGRAANRRVDVLVLLPKE